MNAPAPVFAPSLRGDENDPLRRRVAALCATGALPEVRVDSVLGLWAELERSDGPPADAPRHHLLFDLNRLFVYAEPAEPDGARIDSVVRFIVDGYPFQPFELLAQRLGGEPHRFLYDPAVLDVLRLVGPSLQPGRLTILDFATGEIAHEKAHRHPAAGPLRRAAAAAAAGTPARLELRERPVGPSLRSSEPTGLDEMVSPSAAPVRELVEVANHASLPFATTRVMWNQGRQKEFCGGKALRPSHAARVAVCEALERFQVAFLPPGEELVRAPYASVREQAVDPAKLFFAVRGKGAPPLEETPLHWTWAHALADGAPVLVPAQEVWFSAARITGERYLIEPTTSGYALGSSVEEAGLFALLEAVERDAYLTMWYLRRPCERIDPESVRYEPFRLLLARWRNAYPDYALHLFDIGNDVAVPSVAAIAVRERGDGPRTFHAAASRLSAQHACFAALKDLTGFNARMKPGRREEMLRLLSEPERIEGPSEHFELYALDETFERLSFLDFGRGPGGDVRELDRRAAVPPCDRYELRWVLRTLVQQLRPLGVEAYLKEITHPSVAARGLHCVKAITPGLYPIWFGSRLRRFAVTERLRRLGREMVGRELGAPEDFNLEVHPFS